MADAPPPLTGDLSPAPVPATTTHKDRKAGLVFFGIVEMLLGCLAILVIGLMVLGQVMMAKTTGEPPQLRMILPSVASYGGMAIALITLGIGSVRARRWARALSLVLSWAWLTVGVFAVGMIAFIVPKMLHGMGGGGPPIPPPALAIAIAVSVAILVLFFVVVPGVLIWFYRSRHVKATCEARDPQVRWTDAVSLPCLGLSLWLGISAAYMLLMPFMMNGVLPVFGVILSGWSGSLGYFILAGVWIYCAMATYQLEPAGWWLALATLCLMSASALISFSHIELSDLYQRMGYSQSQIEMMSQWNFLQGRDVGYLAAAAGIPVLAYLIWVKRFFRQAA